MIRETRDEDAPGVVDLLNEVYPSWLNTEAAWLHRRRSEPERSRRLSLVAVESNRIVALGGGRLDHEAARAGAARIHVAVRTESRGRGIGGRLYERAEAHVVANGGRRLLTTTIDEEPSRRFAELRGFRHTLTGRISSVDPRDVDLSGFSALETEAKRQGFRLVPMADVSAEDIYRIAIEAARDIPQDEPFGDVPFAEWEQAYWRHPSMSFEASRAVVYEAEAVAFAMIHADRDRGKAMNEMTGTLREFRGRRLARLAKLGTIAWALENGIAQILTGNDETNAPMLAINESLGYRPIDAELSWVKEV